MVSVVSSFQHLEASGRILSFRTAWAHSEFKAQAAQLATVLKAKTRGSAMRQV